MAKRSVEDDLKELSLLAKEPDRAHTREVLVKGLSSRSNFVVERAASVAGHLKRTDLTGELIAAFDRFLIDPKSPDKGCAAKTAIAKVLYEIGHPSAEPVFLAGIKHVQPEGSYGPPVDAAGELRGQCALGLVRIGHRHAMLHLVDLLNDPVPQARAFAARALAYSERDDAALFLRFKLLIGDREIDVINECMSALARFRQHDLPQFLGRFLDHDEPDIRISAALALRETRQADALEILRDRLPFEHDPDARRALFLAAATLRIPQAIEWVVHLIESAKVDDTVDALEALSLYRRDAAIAERVRNASSSRKEREIVAAYKKYFPDDRV